MNVSTELYSVVKLLEKDASIAELASNALQFGKDVGAKGWGWAKGLFTKQVQPIPVKEPSEVVGNAVAGAARSAGRAVQKSIPTMWSRLGEFLGRGATGYGIGTGYRMMRSGIRNPNAINQQRFNAGLGLMAKSLGRTGLTYGAGLYGAKSLYDSVRGNSQPQVPEYQSSQYYFG